eukprot:CAMPEP_0196658164 /NCGR_PEP_ID=MMETSP1086-20130531/27722_1 /TAXON_ID=77921 /ORGANISM="Cyanoptyche  gloeocystis , Strain SAG4.97" /LENGTH=435 /DNA_ID=CAMNT_0041991609 /DNA_START=184 /DNA_END=1491 /DNA_ORIENTATION=-
MLAQNINILASGDAQLLALYNEYTTENLAAVLNLFPTAATVGGITLNLSPTQFYGQCQISGTALQPISGGTGYTTIASEPFADIYGTLSDIYLANGGNVKVCFQSKSTATTLRTALSTYLTDQQTALNTAILAYINGFTNNVLTSTIPYTSGTTAYTSGTSTLTSTVTTVSNAISAIDAGTCDIAFGVEYTTSLDNYRISCPYAFVPTDGSTDFTASPATESAGSYLVMLVKADPQLNVFQNPSTTATATTPASASSALFTITAYKSTTLTALTAWTGTLAFKFRFDLAKNLSISEYRVMFSSNPAIYTFGSTAVTVNGKSTWVDSAGATVSYYPYSFPIEISNVNSTGQNSVVGTIGVINVGVSTGRLLAQSATTTQPSTTSYIIYNTDGTTPYNVKAVGVNFQYGPGSAGVMSLPLNNYVLICVAVLSALLML